jgi:hypothetical protein
MTQLTNELTRAKQTRISNDQTGSNFIISVAENSNSCFFFHIEIHSLVDSIRQTYETEINDFKHIIQLFDTTDPNEHMTEIVRLRKKIDELTANKVVRLFFI